MTDWQPISSAPKDGTAIELENSFGEYVWYAVCKWAGGTWQFADNPHAGMMDGPYLRWRLPSPPKDQK